MTCSGRRTVLAVGRQRSGFSRISIRICSATPVVTTRFLPGTGAGSGPAAGTCCRPWFATGGPDLSRIGSTLTRPQLVEALLAPNARIAPGFGVVSVTLKNGDKADGTLRSETDTEVVLLTGTPPAERKIAKADIASRTDPISAMPPLGLILKPREVRDLVEFLAGMR